MLGFDCLWLVGIPPGMCVCMEGYTMEMSMRNTNNNHYLFYLVNSMNPAHSHAAVFTSKGS